MPKEKQNGKKAHSSSGVARLTDAEIRDVNKLLEAGKPLPDKYRFLLFEDKREVELVWNGKTEEVCNIVLPFQTIEQVDEPRAENHMMSQQEMFDPETGRQLKGWTNKLIWGDNKLILSSLAHGPLREKIEAQGGLKLIYIDPPFDVGADFSMNIEIGGDTFTKKPNILEEIAYRDTWGKGQDSFIAMIYERLILMRNLLADDGSIYVHCDWRVNSHIRLALDEVFGRDNFINENIWAYKTGGLGNRWFGRKHDTIFFYGKNKGYIFNVQKEKSYLSHKYGFSNIEIKEDEQGYYTITRARDIWEIAALRGNQPESISYPTQKPEALLERIIKASSNEGDLVADFFCGSGTTAAVAEKLGRKWIATDLGKFAIHTTRKRMIGVQRQLKKDNKNYRAFEILNLGKYERQHYISVNPNLREEEKQRQLTAKEDEFTRLILHAYRAEKVDNFATFQGKKGGRMVSVGPVNMPVSRLFVEEIILQCRKHRITKVDVLGFEFEMGLFPNVLDDARAKGIDLAPKYIPAEVFDKRAVENNQVVFHDVAYIEIKTHITKGAKGKPAKVAIALTDFSVYYTQDSIAHAEEALGKKRQGSKIVAEGGRLIKVSRDKAGKVSRETLTPKWTDWIDYWSVDFDFESKREIIRELNPETNEIEEKWTGDYIFENEWQSFRTRKDRKLELKSVAREYRRGKHKIAVKVVDIFGNDTMTIKEITL